MDSYEQPEFPLNAEAQRALASLPRKIKMDDMNGMVTRAQANLSNTVAEIYDDLLPRVDRVTRVKAIRQRATQNENEGDEPDESLEEMEAKAEKMRAEAKDYSERMEQNMRKLVDCRQNIAFMHKGIEATESDVRANASTQASTQGRSQRTRRARYEGDEDEESEHELPDFTPTDPAGGTQQQRAPKDVFEEHVGNAQTRYGGIDHTERYANNNEYRKFRQMWHDAQHPEDDVPLPHPDTWFQADGEPAAGVVRRTGGDEEDDDDLVMMRSAVSTKCPITLAELKDPLMSKKCPHVFEKYAIHEFIEESGTRPKATRCPVTGCSQMIEKNDLHVDPVVLRKIQRVQRSRQLQLERENESGDDAPDGTQGHGLTIDDDDDDDAVDIDELDNDHPPTRMKSEPRPTGASRASVSGPAPPGPSQVMDLSEEEDEDENMLDE